MARRVAFLIFPDFQLLDAAGPISAFEIAERYQPGSYELRLIAPQAGPVTADRLSRARRRQPAFEDEVWVCGARLPIGAPSWRLDYCSPAIARPRLVDQ